MFRLRRIVQFKPDAVANILASWHWLFLAGPAEKPALFKQTFEQLHAFIRLVPGRVLDCLDHRFDDEQSYDRLIPGRWRFDLYAKGMARIFGGGRRPLVREEDDLRIALAGGRSQADHLLFIAPDIEDDEQIAGVHV